MSSKKNHRCIGKGKKRNSKQQIPKNLSKTSKKRWKVTKKHVKDAARLLLRKSVNAFFNWVMVKLAYIYGILKAPEMVEVVLAMGLLALFVGIYLGSYFIDKAKTILRRIVRSIEKKK